MFPFWIPLLDMRERVVGVLYELRLQVSGADTNVVVAGPATGLCLGVRLEICASEGVGAHVPPFRGVIPLPGKGTGGESGVGLAYVRFLGMRADPFARCVCRKFQTCMHVACMCTSTECESIQ